MPAQGFYPHLGFYFLDAQDKHDMLPPGFRSRKSKQARHFHKKSMRLYLKHCTQINVKEA
ncbi:hypothetical protein F0267_01285 [Vibrio coralliilyticus]|uniref:Uncharacterized protein n=2 Tax=Vibrio TaxID=662 RepID=A0AAN0SJ82_9VIBR|nr:MULTISPECIES: hypothetical protein [Vibrio]AIW22301.1 hypothetical protein IX92_24845 [Vibrio coralliilyticus]MCZ2798963.1 hypothetical protein [Vibrio alginolyticus]NOH36856.1 hypothetical protein [Vibrio coralliilyticus]PAW02374.1 hypothetical protein CKJ79_17070 [Vibrio coralliilyticus]POB47107.1 hypothetical protein CRN52_13595 [Vibrio vulnificus]